MNPVNQAVELDILNEDEEIASIFWTDENLNIWTAGNGSAWTTR